MATFTINIPADLKKEMDEMSEINWPEFIKKKFEVRVQQLYKFEELIRRGEI